MNDLREKIEQIFGEVMEDIKIFVKKYGLYVVIGVIAFYLINKFREKK